MHEWVTKSTRIDQYGDDMVTTETHYVCNLGP